MRLGDCISCLVLSELVESEPIAVFAVPDHLRILFVGGQQEMPFL